MVEPWPGPDVGMTGYYCVLLGRRRGVGQRDRFDDHVFDRHVRVHAAAAGLDLADRVDDVGAVDDFAEHGVAPAVLAWIVEEAVVLDVDEELRRGRMRRRGAG